MKSLNRILSAVVLAITLLAVPVFSQPQSKAQAAQQVMPVVHHVPVLIRDGRIYVYALVGGKKALLLVDTGATVSTFKFKLVPPHQGVAPTAFKIQTATGQSDCVRLETSVDLIGTSDKDVSRMLVGAIFGPFDFGPLVDGLLGADVLLNGRYSSVAFDLEHNEMILTEKAGVSQ